MGSCSRSSWPAAEWSENAIEKTRRRVRAHLRFGHCGTILHDIFLTVGCNTMSQHPRRVRDQDTCVIFLCVGTQITSSIEVKYSPTYKKTATCEACESTYSSGNTIPQHPRRVRKRTCGKYLYILTLILIDMVIRIALSTRAYFTNLRERNGHTQSIFTCLH